MFRAAGVSDKGRIRPANEDSFAIDADRGLAVIADGMGGHRAGEVASRMAVESLLAYFRTAHADWPFGFDPSLTTDGNHLRSAILLANAEILESSIATAEYAGMGTTVVAALVTDGRLVCGHVGDSRLYLLSKGGMRQVTADDSWMTAMLARDPAANPALLRQHPMRHALTNVVGARTGTDVHVADASLEAGDVILMTTDGVHEILDERQLEMLLRREQEPQVMAEAIVKMALGRGTRDNLTAVVAVIQPTNL